MLSLRCNASKRTCWCSQKTHHLSGTPFKSISEQNAVWINYSRNAFNYSLLAAPARQTDTVPRCRLARSTLRASLERSARVLCWCPTAHDSGRLKSKVSLIGLKSRCWPGWFLLEALRASVLLPFQLVEATCVPYLMAPSSGTLTSCFSSYMLFYWFWHSWLGLIWPLVITLVYPGDPG